MTENLNQQEALSPFGTFVAIFTAPSRAMQSVLQRSRPWFPLLLSIVCGAALVVWYYQTVDFSWLQDKLTASINDPATRAQTQKLMSKSLMLGSSGAFLLIGVPILYAIFALYFFLVAKVRNLPIGYGKWFGFVAWVSVPGVLTLPLGAMQILMAQGGHLGLSQLNPVTLNSLFLHLEPGQPWASFGDSLSLITVWSIVVSVIGFQVWSKASRAVSAMIVLAPYVLMYGVMALIAIMSKAA